jgi:hypothetical protein
MRAPPCVGSRHNEAFRLLSEPKEPSLTRPSVFHGSADAVTLTVRRLSIDLAMRRAWPIPARTHDNTATRHQQCHRASLVDDEWRPNRSAFDSASGRRKRTTAHVTNRGLELGPLRKERSRPSNRTRLGPTPVRGEVQQRLPQTTGGLRRSRPVLLPVQRVLVRLTSRPDRFDWEVGIIVCA